MVKLALLGDSATQLLTKAIAKAARANGQPLELFESDFNQIDQVVNMRSSELYAFNPDAVLLLWSSEALQQEYYSTSLAEREQFAARKIVQIKHLIACLKEQAVQRKVMLANFAEINDGVFGNNANKSKLSFLLIVRQLNVALMEIAADDGGVSILDIAMLQSRLGRNQMFDPRLYVTASMVFSIESLPLIARNILDLLAAAQSRARKCLILDLDNTVWGGVIGDDGVENIEIGELGLGKAFTRLQCWAKELQRRGILIAVCSKNTEAVAKEPFERHPDMVLKLEDISVFVANWDDKVSNIRYIQSMLNIGFDSMVFVDDNPFERELVKSGLPEVTVPSLPEDPADYMDFLQELNLFEAGTSSALDADRTKMIQREIERQQIQGKFESEEDFLKNLAMVCHISDFNVFNTPRVAQLSERSNQYNLRTLRYTEQDVKDIAQSTSRIGMAFSLEDRLGDHGLISVVVLRQDMNVMFVENWFMSCRVLKRGVELLVLDTIAASARSRGCDLIVGEYVPTKKNALVQDHYRNLGFEDVGGGMWQLKVVNFMKPEYFINGVGNV
jgi:FkbH-like protein